ncbi:MAG: FG-GAP repeat domain-containing protein [Burkholderiales bacterium]
MLVAGTVCAAAPALEILPPATPATAAACIGRPADAVPDTRVTCGRRDIAAAWFTEPTDRYQHGALGDFIEAATLKVRLRQGTELRFTLADDSVFEDLEPRLADLDGDGRDEVLVVRSNPRTGAALAVFGVREGRLALLAEAAPIGRGNRWLNPVGVADLDGDGSPEIAVVLTPHIGGTLVVYRYTGSALQERARLSGFSNHALGSHALSGAAIVDADGDGRMDLVVPSADRRVIRVIAFDDGKLREIAAVPLPAAAAGNITTEARGVTVPLADGRRARITWR